jgi:phage-related protein
VNEIPVVFGQFIGPILDDISARFNEAFGTNIDLSAGIGEMFSRLQTTMQGPLEAIGLAFDRISAAIGPFVEVWGPMLAALFTDVIAPAIGYAIAIIGEVIALLLMFGTAAGEAIQAAIEWFQQLPENVGNAINAVVEWFQSLPDRACAALQNLKDGASKKIGDLIGYVKKLPSNIKSAIGNLASAMQQKGRDIIDGIKNGVVNRWGNLRAWLAGIPSRVRSSIGSVAGTLAQKGRDIISGLKSGLTGAWGSVRGWVSGIPTRIKNALGSVGSLLSSAGRSIINGLKSGMVSAFNNVKKWVSGVAATIRSLKGPLDYDKTVLIDNGEALMYGLQKGLSTSFEGKVKPYVKSMAGEMSDAFNVAAPSVTAAGAVGAGGQSVVYNVYIDGDALGVNDRITAALGVLVEAVEQSHGMGRA